MKILGIIPARGGSKGIPRKNLVDVCGQPLIAYSIATGLRLCERGALARCIVSTDDDEISAVAKAHGADVPFMRPAAAANDTAKAQAYVTHALDVLEQEDGSYDAVLLLQPTSPIRDVDDFCVAIERFKVGQSESMISCYREEYINDLVMYQPQPDGTLVPRNPDHNKGVRRQEHGASMVRNGALYITRVPYFRATGQLVCDRPMLMEMDKRSSVDVDAPDDLIILRAVMCK